MKWRREYEYQSIDQEFTRQDEWYLMKRLEILAEDEEARLKGKKNDRKEESRDDIDDEKPGRKDRKAREIFEKSQVEFKEEYYRDKNPVALKIQKKYAEKYWAYYAQYLLDTWQIGEADKSGKLIPYQFFQLKLIDEGDNEYVMIYVQGKNLRTNDSQEKNELINDNVAANDQAIQTNHVEESNEAKEEWDMILSASSPDALEVVEETTRYSGTPRPDIKWDVELTPEQQSLYQWNEALALIKSGNPELTDWTARQFTRRVLADGWDMDKDPMPRLKEIYDVELDAEARHIIEARTYEEAFAYANKKKKAGDATYNRFIWRSKIAHKDKISGTKYAPDNAFENYTINLDLKPRVNFDELAVFAGSEANGYLKQIKSKKEYSDQLLSPVFVNLVYKVQQKLWPEPANAVLRTGIWNAATKKKYAAYPVEQQKKIDDEKLRQKKIHDHWYYEGEDANNGYTKYIRDGRTLMVNDAKLKELKDALANDVYGADEVLEDYHENLPLWKEDLVYMLTAWERSQVFKAYSEELNVDDAEEKVITMVLRNTPPSQYTAMRTYIKQYENNNSMKDWIDNDANISEYNTQREKILGVVDTQAISDTYDYVDTNDDAEDEAEDLNAKLPLLSAGQIKKFDWNHRQMYLDTFLQEDGPTDEEDWYYFDKLFINTPSYHIELLKAELEANNFIKFVRLVERTPESQKENINLSLDIWYATDATALKKLRAIAKRAKRSTSTFDIDVNILYSMPNAVYERLTDDERVKVYKYVLNYSNINDHNLVIITKVLDSVASGVTDEYKYRNQRQSFFDNVKGTTMLDEEIEDDDQLDHLKSVMNDMDFEGRKHRINETLENSRYGIIIVNEADDLIAQLGDSDMAWLNLPKRKEAILNLVGRNGFESFFTRVGDRDEKTLIRLIYTCPDEDMKNLMDWLAAESGSMYETLQSAIDGENFDKLHETFSQKKHESVENEQDPAKKKQMEAEVLDKQQRGQNTASGSLPWDQYSYLGLLFFSSGIEYSVEWTEDGKIAVEYESMDWKDGYFGGLIYQSYKGETHPAPFGAWDWVAVYAKEDDEELGLVEGEVRLMPAINLFKFEHVQDVAHIWEAVDIVSLLIGFGELKAAVSFIRWLVAFTDVVLSVGNMLTRTFGHRLPESWITGWQALSSEIATYQFIYLGVTFTRGLRNRLKSAREELAKVTDLKPNERKALETLLDTDEAMLNEAEAIAKSSDKNYLQKTLDDLEANKSGMEPVAYNNLKSKISERLALIDDEVHFKNLPENQVPKENVLPSKIVTDIADDVTDAAETKHSISHFIKTVDGKVEFERVEIVYQGRKMNFTRKPGDIWSYVSDEKNIADEMTDSMLRELNTNGVDDIANRIKNDVFDLDDHKLLKGTEAEPFLLMSDAKKPKLIGKYVKGKYLEIISKSKKLYGGNIIQLEKGVTTTITGILDDVNTVRERIGNVMGPNPGSVNMLNSKRWGELITENTGMVDGIKVVNWPKVTDDFWKEINQKWLQEAIDRGDNFRLVSDPTLEINLWVTDKVTGEFILDALGQKQRSIFGREVDMFLSNGYTINTDGIAIKN